jgi:hypothetical protein
MSPLVWINRDYGYGGRNGAYGIGDAQPGISKRCAIFGKNAQNAAPVKKNTLETGLTGNPSRRERQHCCAPQRLVAER